MRSNLHIYTIYSVSKHSKISDTWRHPFPSWENIYIVHECLPQSDNGFLLTCSKRTDCVWILFIFKILDRGAQMPFLLDLIWCDMFCWALPQKLLKLCGMRCRNLYLEHTTYLAKQRNNKLFYILANTYLLQSTLQTPLEQ